VINISFFRGLILYNVDLERLPNQSGYLNTLNGSFNIHIRTDTEDADLEGIFEIIKEIILSDSNLSTIEHQLKYIGFSNPTYFDEIETIINEIEADLFSILRESEEYTLMAPKETLLKSLHELEEILERIDATHQKFYALAPAKISTLDKYRESCNSFILRIEHILSIQENKTLHIDLLEKTVMELRSIQNLNLNFDLWYEKCDTLDEDYTLSCNIELLKPLMHQKNRLSIPKLSTMYEKADQDKYSASMHAWIHLVSLYKNKYSLNFYQTLLLFSYGRRTLANSCLTAYGIPRLRKDMYTKLTEQYQEISERVAVKYPQLLTSGIYSTKAILNEKEITLSEIQPSLALLQHTNYLHIPSILTHVETLYERAAASVDKEEIIYLSGQIFWWVCQAKPWQLGDPSIAEMLFRSLWEEKGIESPSWGPSIIPWVEVSVEFDVETFARNFPSLFNWEF
jgi:hypothetical protein